MAVTETTTSPQWLPQQRRTQLHHIHLLEWLADYFAKRTRGGCKPASFNLGSLASIRLNRQEERQFRELYKFNYRDLSRTSIRNLYDLMTAEQPSYHTYFFELFKSQCGHRKGRTHGLSEDSFELCENVHPTGSYALYAIRYRPPPSSRHRRR